MNKLSEHINEEIEKFNDRFHHSTYCLEQLQEKDGKVIESTCRCDFFVTESLFRQSLKSIAYKSIEAVRVDGRSSINVEHPHYERFCEDDYVFNSAIDRSAQKEKEYKDGI